MEYKDFCRVKVNLSYILRLFSLLANLVQLLRHHPFWQEYDFCHTHHNRPDESYNHLIHPRVIDEFKDEDIPEENIPNSWQALVNQLLGQYSSSSETQLGLRPHDLEYNWDLQVRNFPHVNSNHWIHQKSPYHEDQNPVDFFPVEAISSLNLKQRQIYDLFM